MTEMAEMTSQMKRQRTQNSWPTSLEGSFLMKPRWLIPLHLLPPAAGGNRNPHPRKGSSLISSPVAAAGRGIFFSPVGSLVTCCLVERRWTSAETTPGSPRDLFQSTGTAWVRARFIRTAGNLLIPPKRLLLLGLNQ